MNMNLMLALFWLILGLAVLAWPWLNPGAPELHLWNTRLSGVWGWLAILMAVYNVARWWHLRSTAAQRRRQEEVMGRLERQADRHRPIRERDPNLDFTGQPPPPERPNGEPTG